MILEGHTGFVTSVAINHECTLIVSGSEDCTIKVWNFRLKREVFNLNGHSGPVKSVTISSNSQIIVSGSADNTIKT